MINLRGSSLAGAISEELSVLKSINEINQSIEVILGKIEGFYQTQSSIHFHHQSYSTHSEYRNVPGRYFLWIFKIFNLLQLNLEF